MEAPDPSYRLGRVQFQLRTSRVPHDQPNPLLSGVHHRGYLPHVKCEGASYFVTTRLADSLPKDVLLKFLAERASRLRELERRKNRSPGKGRDSVDTLEEIERDYRRKVERYLDKGAGECYLRRPEIAGMVAGALLYFDGQQYLLDDWVVMPNHIHFILWPMPNFTLSNILKSRKQYSATEANRILDRIGQSFWQPESFDHWIRNESELARIRHYIRCNPVTAGLCARPEDWRWSSAWQGF